VVTVELYTLAAQHREPLQAILTATVGLVVVAAAAAAITAAAAAAVAAAVQVQAIPVVPGFQMCRK
jgi:hypothetical protein